MVPHSDDTLYEYGDSSSYSGDSDSDSLCSDSIASSVVASRAAGSMDMSVPLL